MTRPGMKPLGFLLKRESARLESLPSATLGVVTNAFARRVRTTHVRSADGKAASPNRAKRGLIGFELSPDTSRVSRLVRVLTKSPPKKRPYFLTRIPWQQKSANSLILLPNSELTKSQMI